VESNIPVGCDREVEFDGERWHNGNEECNGDDVRDVSVTRKLPPSAEKDFSRWMKC